MARDVFCPLALEDIQERTARETTYRKRKQDRLQLIKIDKDIKEGTICVL